MPQKIIHAEVCTATVQSDFGAKRIPMHKFGSFLVISCAFHFYYLQGLYEDLLLH